MGAAVDVLVFYNTVYAGIGNQAVITAGSLDIDADVTRGLTLYAAAGSLGGFAAAGSVVVVSTGAKVTSDKEHEALGDGNTVTSLQTNADKAMDNAKLKDNSDETGTGKPSSGIAKANSSIGNIQVRNYFNKESVADKVSAYIGNETTVHTGSGSVTVNAAETTNLKAVSGTVAGGGIAVGGSVLIATMNANTESRINGTVEAGNVTIGTNSTVAAGDDGFKAIAGQGGVVSIGASVSILKVNGKADAIMGAGADVRATGDVDITSKLDLRVKPRTASASGGGIVAGASIASIQVKGQTVAGLEENAQLADAANVRIKAYMTGDSDVYSIAAGGGLAAAVANEALVSVGNTVKTFMNTGSRMTGVGSVSLVAQADMKTQVNAEGLTAGGIAIGASNATLTMGGTVSTEVVADAAISADTLNMAALYNTDDEGNYLTDHK